MSCSTPKRGREDDDERSSSRRRPLHDDGGDDSYGASSPAFGHSYDDVYCSQMDNPTPAALRGMHRGQKQIQDRVHGQVPDNGHAR